MSAGAVRACLDLAILNDNEFENREDFSGLLQSFVVDGLALNTLPRVSFQPERTQIFIDDNDGAILASLSSV